ncbi:MAG: T9SS type A sorting domain-containing protein [Reichenbachiella sp.]
MPQFKHIFLWVYSPNVWVRDDGMRSDELANEDNTVYALTKYLLQQYNGTDKTFYIGQWEADWELVNDVSGIEDWNQNKPTVDQHRIDGMIAQINARQAAVDRAKGEGGFSGVQVYNYTEVNLPKARSLDQGLASMLSHVLPHVNVDFVSYSCYDAIRNYSDETTIRQNLMTVMDTLQNALPAKAGLPFEKRVFVGEFGFPNGREDKYNTYAEPQSQEDQDLWSRYAMKAAIEWGSPFALYWTFYGNEHKTVDGIDWNTQNGYWMIDNINRKQKIYHTYKNYYAAAKQGVADFMNANSNSLPSEAQFRTIALNALNGASNTSSRNFEEERKVLAEEKPNLSLRVYPNPVTDQFFISNHSLSISSVHLFDLSGNKILTASKFNQGVIRLDVSALKKGIYLLKATTIENTISTIKIMKK